MSKQCPNCQRSISCPWCDGTIKALDEAKAQAKLVPELLEACKRLRRQAKTGKPMTMSDVAVLDYAIAKAESN